MGGMVPANSAAPATSPTASSAATNDVWQIKVIRSGGLAGLEESFTANAASTALLITDVTRGTGTTVALTPVQKLELGQAIARRIDAPDLDTVSPCRDCYQFEMVISSGPGSRQRKVRLDSVTMESSPDASLVERVITIARAGSTRNTP
jgi:hypothetical protein